MIKRSVFVSVVLAVLGGAVSAHAQQMDCGNPFDKELNGPFDYRTASEARRVVVERRHFTDDVRNMRSGSTTKDLAADIAYTLRTFPNHHAALSTMAEWSVRSGRNPPAGSRYTVECWFERGIKFRPDDYTVRMLYGIYLSRKSRDHDAIAQYEKALEVGGDTPNLRYNLGLAYVEVREFDKALEHAHSAYSRGFNLPGLKAKLVRAGVWREPPSAVGPVKGGGE